MKTEIILCDSCGYRFIGTPDVGDYIVINFGDVNIKYGDICVSCKDAVKKLFINLKKGHGHTNKTN